MFVSVYVALSLCATISVAPTDWHTMAFFLGFVSPPNAINLSVSPTLVGLSWSPDVVSRSPGALVGLRPRRRLVQRCALNVLVVVEDGPLVNVADRARHCVCIAWPLFAWSATNDATNEAMPRTRLYVVTSRRLSRGAREPRDGVSCPTLEKQLAVRSDTP